ncbi:MAG: hypothetical protein GF388_04080, partial [Candidatus Aegiribacteria sp.]|nr:hypothetical protein [Candidatus Aegiribacteria sp.]MBD3294418.1 hypothetical protein [Candidatus Fermentibacteria bacterium]
MALFGKKKEKSKRETKAVPQPAADELLNYIIVILDSCRWDTFMEASPQTIMKLSEPETRYSYA